MVNFTEKSCRLCYGQLVYVFSLKVLTKYCVKYYKCGGCNSLQTEAPFWLDEAYGDGNLSNIDTGAAQRNLRNLAACWAISKLFNLKNAIDIGGGDGLLCRLLRDYNINCYVEDKYAIQTYGKGFTDQDFEIPDLITGFEVLEHYENPVVNLSNIFSYNPKVVLFTTALYNHQKEDWWYLSPEAGQHIFFYSKEAIESQLSRRRKSEARGPHRRYQKAPKHP